MRLLLRWLINTLALFVTVNVVPHFHYRSFLTLALAALVLGLLNALIRPILFVLTFPITVVTLGLFLLVLNGIVLEIAAWVVPGFSVDGFGWAILGALVLTIISLFTNRIGERRREQ